MTVGRTGHCTYGDTPCVDRRGAFDALLSPVDWAPARLLSSTRGFGYAAVHCYLRKLKTYVSVVCFEHHFAQFLDHPGFDPLVASISKRGSRARLISDP